MRRPEAKKGAREEREDLAAEDDRQPLHVGGFRGKLQ